MKRHPCIQRRRTHAGQLGWVAVGEYFGCPITVWFWSLRCIGGKRMFQAQFNHPQIDGNYTCTAWGMDLGAMMAKLEPTVYFRGGAQ